MYMHHEAIAGPCACTLLRKAARAVGRLYDDALAGHGMTTARFALLRHIARGEPLPLSRLAEQLVLDRTSLYRALAPVEAEGWVSVAAGTGKTKLASLTEAGRAALADAEADWAAVQERIASEMGAEWGALQKGLAAITGLAQQGAH